MDRFSEPRYTYHVQRNDDGQLVGPFVYEGTASIYAKEHDGLVVRSVHPDAKEDDSGTALCRCGERANLHYDAPNLRCWRCDREYRLKTAVGYLSDIGNMFGRGSYPKLAEEIVRLHRTIQQNLCALVVNILGAMAYQTGGIDRNDAPAFGGVHKLDDVATMVKDTLIAWRTSVDREENPYTYPNFAIDEYGPCWDLRNAASVHLARLFVSLWRSLPDNLKTLPYV